MYKKCKLWVYSAVVSSLAGLEDVGDHHDRQISAANPRIVEHSLCSAQILRLDLDMKSPIGIIFTKNPVDEMTAYQPKLLRQRSILGLVDSTAFARGQQRL